MWRRGSAKRVLGSAGLLERSAGAAASRLGACNQKRPFRPAIATADAAFPSVESSSATVRRFTSPPTGVGSDDRSLYQNPSTNKNVRQQFQKSRNRNRGSNNSPNWQAATNHNRNRKQDAAAIAEITSQLASLQYLIAEVGLEDRIPIWNYDHESTQDVHADERDEILQQIGAVVDELRHYVFQKNILHPSGKHRHAFSAILERILGLYLQCSSPETQLYPNQVAGGNDSLLGLMQHFQMELTHRQCDLAVQVAAREGRFREAAQLYASHIDPDQGGYTPVTGSSSTMETIIAGLYCMARGAALESGGGGMPTEQVFEGVLNLSLVSSSDTEKYVLAAGVALGYAGEWEGLREYLKSSYRASELGQPLVAATMHACILCGRYDEALAVFDDLLGGELAAASEWQWGGGVDRMHPACRDLAMRALGGSTSEDTLAVRERALGLFHQALEEDAKVSVEALSAIIGTFEHGGDWESVVDIFLKVLDNPPNSWLVPGEGVHLTVENSGWELSSDEIVVELGTVLNRVMRVCNSSKKFGLSLLCLQLFDSLLAESIKPSEGNLFDETTPAHSNITQSTLSTIFSLRNTKDLIQTTMIALCGMQVPQKAIELEEYCFSAAGDTKDRDRFDVYSYAEFLKDTSTFSGFSGSSWEAVHRHVHRLVACVRSIEDKGERISETDARLLSSVLATSIRECVSARQPEAALTLGKWIEKRQLQGPVPEPHTVFSRGDEGFRLPVPLTDSLLSSAIEAFSTSGKADVAMDLAHSYLGDERTPAKWLLSYHEAVKTLFAQGQSEDAMTLFRTILASGRNPAMFCTAARNQKDSGDWRAILDLYRLALSSGCVSEELSLLAMEAVAASGRVGQNEQQFPLLRSIIGETAKSVGSSPNDWVATNYWRLKHLLGFSTARLIMGWDDQQTSRLDELELALEVMENRSASGLTPKNDVLLSIANAAANFDRLAVPFNKTGIAKVPRGREAWIQMLERALDEAKDTKLLYDTRFINDTATAFERLGCNLECIEIVNSAISRGLTLRKPALQSAVKAAEAEGIAAWTSDIELLLADN